MKNFFPGTGKIEDNGSGLGSYFKVNVPLEEGCLDDTYDYIFKNIFERILATFRPDVIFV